MMQAIQITTFLPDEAPYSSLKPSLIPKPLPKDDQVLVRITHVALQQVDLLFSRGKHQENNARLGHVHPPFVLGMEWAGVVESLPLGNTSKHQLTVGDRVMGQCYGAFAEYLCCTPVSQARKIAADMSSAAAATLSGGLVSYAAVHEKAQVKAGDTVLVSGANGGLGVVACQIAKAIGARVIALVSTEDKAEYLRKHIDLDHVVAMGTDKEWIKTVNSITQGKGVNSVIDNIGMVEDGLRCVKFGGRIVVVGFAGRNGVMEKVPMNKILLKGAVVIGYVSHVDTF